MPYKLLFCLWFLFAAGDLKAIQPEFSNRIDLGPVTNKIISEASGLAVSSANWGFLWTHNDSGDGPYIYLIGKNAEYACRVRLTDAENVDWEDIQIGPGPVDSIKYLYIADIGDNDGVRTEKVIYRLPEPAVYGMKSDTSTGNVEKITFVYPDGKHNAEILLLDPLTKDLFIITKNTSPARLYKLPYPQSTNELLTATFSRELPFGYDGSTVFTQPVGGCISHDGSEILVKNYYQVFYYQRKPGESIEAVLSGKADTLGVYNWDLFLDPQCEAICWDTDGTGFFTISESVNGSPVHLFYYKKLTSGVEKNGGNDEGALIRSLEDIMNIMKKGPFSTGFLSDNNGRVINLRGASCEMNQRQAYISVGVYFYNIYDSFKYFRGKIIHSN